MYEMYGPCFTKQSGNDLSVRRHDAADQLRCDGACQGGHLTKDRGHEKRAYRGSHPLVAWLVGFAAAILLPSILCGASNSVVATFDGSPSISSNFVKNYAIGYGQLPRGTSASFNYPSNLVFSKTNLSVTVSNLGPGWWFFSVYAIATNDIRSDYSNEAAWTNKAFGPTNLRIVGPVDALALQSSVDNRTWKTLAVITSTNQPLVVQAVPSQFFRTTNVPPPLPMR